MAEINREQRNSGLSRIYTYLQDSLNRIPPTLDTADEYTQEKELTEPELAVARDIFLAHNLPEPLSVSLVHQWGSLQPDLEDMGDMQSEIAAIHVTTDIFDVIYGFYRTAGGAYYTDRSVQPHEPIGQHSQETLAQLGTIAHNLLAPADKEDLLHGPVKMPLYTGEVQPSDDELRALARLVESLQVQEDTEA